MPLTKYASFEVAEVLDIKGARTRQHSASLDKIADFENYRTHDGYLYCRIRAISSRVNKNHDGWPSVELAGSREIFDRHHSGSGFTVEASEGNPEYGFRTFIGKPIFVDHHNSNPKKARGVIVDAKLNVLDHKTATKHDSYWGGHDVDNEHLPPTEVELLLEVDAKSFPRLAQAIVSGDLDGFSMGCDVDYSKCSHCGHTASAPEEYCSHILMKGAHHDFKSSEGKRVSRKSYENCYGIKFFEISAVFDPADETALAREVRSAVNKEADLLSEPSAGGLPDPIRPPRDEIEAEATRLVQQQGVSMDNALELAEQKLQQQRGGLPGHGEGMSMDSYPKQWDYSPMPKQMPPAQPQFPPASPFGQAAEEELNRAHPRRPVMNDPRWSSHTRLAENPLPQEMMLRAPEELDTLRDEQLCPICGNDMDEETCQVCGYVQPPKEFDNPDLDKAQEIRQEMKTQEEQIGEQPQPGAQPSGGAPPTGPNPMGGGSPPPPPAGASKGPATAKVTSDMHKWTPKLHPKTAARINQAERPVNASNPPVTNEPQNEVVTKDQTKPVTSAMRNAQRLMATAQHNHYGAHMNRTADGPQPAGGSDTSQHQRVDVTGIGGVDVATNEQASKSHDDNNGKPDSSGYKQVDVLGIGGTGVENVSADSTDSLSTAGQDSDDSGFNTDKNIEAIHTQTFGDKDGQHPGVGDPVTSETPYWIDESDWDKATYNSHQRRAYEDGTLESLDQQGDPIAQGGTAVKGVQPVAEQFGERVNLLEHKTSPANNSGPTDTWSGTDGNGVLRQQEPVTREDQEWGGVKVPDVQLHTTGRVSLAALRLAEAEVELGLIAPHEKWNRMAELDSENPQSVQAKLETLARVKTAGLNKLAQHRTTSVTRVPRFNKIATGVEQVEPSPIDNAALDAGLFLR